MKTKTFLLIMIIFTFVSCHPASESVKKDKIKHLHEEISILEDVLNKCIPDSVIQLQKSAERSLSYFEFENGTDEYYLAKKNVWAVQDYIKTSKICRYIDSLCAERQYELVMFE